jgi:type I restriction-modification system DNA methylase subunit
MEPSMINLETISEIRYLVERFAAEDAWSRSEDHIQTYFSVRVLDLLGWTSANVKINQGQDVKTGKKPDIVLQNAGSTLLVIESKDARRKDVLDGHYQDKSFIDQLYGYCKAEGIFWGVLTNFVEWRIYSVHQNMLYQNVKYAFHELLWPDAKKSQYIDLLSEQGLIFFEKLQLTSLLKVKGRWDDDPVYYPKQKEIKDKFFKDLKRWRHELRSSLMPAYRDKYSVESIDFITQMILDRFIFIDYCSDNDIITQDKLHAILYSKHSLSQELARIFSDMNEKFNSEIFAHSECDDVIIDDQVIRLIIKEISEIDFKTMSANVIGEVYESYLSELLKSGKAGIADQRRKGLKKKREQGIYYTPDFVVDYIIESTLGQILLQCRTIEEIDSIRLLDPACGSGSFLIRAFDEFIKHYRRITDEPLLEFEARKRILQNNIFGVDYDERAVEIAKLNLLLKALEGGSLLALTGHKILPNLKLNIRCGNSLISGEIIEEKLRNTLGDAKPILVDLRAFRKKYHNESDDMEQREYLERIRLLEDRLDVRFEAILSKYMLKYKSAKAFNYGVAFPEAFLAGGFDCVVGNPPYIDSELMTKEQPENRDFISAHYDLTKGNWDIYVAFAERAYKLTKSGGYWGIITPDKWLSRPFGTTLRETSLKYMTDLLKVGRDVFADAKVDSIISIFRKKESRKLSVCELRNGATQIINTISKASIKAPFALDTLFSPYLTILRKIASSIAKSSVQFESESACATSDAYDLKPLIKDAPHGRMNASQYYKVTNTGTIAKYKQLWGFKEMTYLGNKYLYPVVDRRQFHKAFGHSYINRTKRSKIIIKGLTLLDACLDLEGDTIPGKSTLVVFADTVDDLKYISAVINSKIAFFYVSQKYPSSSYNKGITFTKDMINSIPIPLPPLHDKARVVNCVNDIIELNTQIDLEKDHKKIEKLSMNIRSMQREIEDILNTIYDLDNGDVLAIESNSR